MKTNSKFFLIVSVTTAVVGAATVIVDNTPTVTSHFISEQQAHGWYQSLGAFERPVDGVMNIGESAAFEVVYERSYPRPSNMCKGINDTLVLQIRYINKSPDKTGWEKNPESWVAPRLFNIWSNIETDVPTVDSTELNYSVRRWVWHGRTLAQAPPDSFPENSYEYTMFMSVWGVPLGHWVLSAGLTENSPANTNMLESGMEFIYYTPVDGQDSVNAYIGCAQRAKVDYDFGTALSWVDSALVYYSKSVPAWWERGSIYFSLGDSIKGGEALDSALYYFDGLRDPLLPDTTKDITPIERQFVRYLEKQLAEERWGEKYKW